MALDVTTGIFCEISPAAPGGDKELAPIVMIPGLGGGADSFEPLLGELANYTILRLELPGTTRAPLGGRHVSMGALVDGVIEFLRIRQTGAVHLVAHSMGTLIAQEIALQHPELVRSLALFGALVEPSAPARANLKARAATARSSGMADIAAQVSDGGTSAVTKQLNPQAVGRIHASLMRQAPEGYARHCEALANARASDFARIRAPVLLVTGDSDRVAPPEMARRIAASIDGASLSILKDCGHWPTLEMHRESARLLVGFLGRLTSRVSAGISVQPTLQETTTVNAPLPSAATGWNNRNSNRTLFRNVRIIDATGERAYSGEVLVEDNRIRQINRSMSNFSTPANAIGSASDAMNVVDGGGATLMPGMIDAHLHLSWNNAPGIDPIQMMETEEHMLVTMEMAKLVLDAGFTAGRGAASAKPRLDVVAKRFINEGRFPGPRYLAAGPEITTVGGLGDSAPSHIPHEGLNLGWVVSGPEEVRRAVRQLIKYGVDSIKLNLSGEAITGMGAEETPMSEEEVAMAASEARCRNKVLSAHARSSGSVKQCIRHGIQNIYHASFADEEALNMLEAARDRHFVAPGIAWLINTARHAEPWGIKPGSPLAEEYERELAMCVDTMKKMHRRGIRICIGGDYGFAWTPQGTNARDIQTFVEMLGFSPMEAIQAATKRGGEIMGMANELGMIREGYLADLLLVDGDPLENVAILQDRNRIRAIMKDGKFHKAPQAL
ncbi:MAG: alpha/beta fold hydrolase [Nitratireductor sp.]